MQLATRILILVNVSIHVYISFLGISNEVAVQRFYEEFGLVPAYFLEGAFWQPITSLFLHFPYLPLHLLVNMIGVWSFGNFLERQIGTSRFLWLYFISGLCASLLIILIPYVFSSSYQDLTRPTIGASGALMGLLGGVAILYPRAKLFVLFFPLRARTAAVILGLLTVLLAIFDSSSFISHNGHLGGLVGGVLYARFVLLLELSKSQQNALETLDSPSPTSSFLYKLRQKFNSLTSGQPKTHYTITPTPAPKESHNKAIEPLPQDQIPPALGHPKSERNQLQEETQDIHESKETDKGYRLVYDPISGKFEYKKE